MSEIILTIVVMMIVALIGLLAAATLYFVITVDAIPIVAKIILTPFVVVLIVGIVILEIELINIIF